MSHLVWLAMLLLTIFAKQGQDTVNAVRGGDGAQAQAGRWLQEYTSAEDTCDGGIEGIQSKSACCPLACGQCGGVGCSTVGGFGAAVCCESGVIDFALPCATKGEAPCVVDVASVPAPAPTVAPDAHEMVGPAQVTPTSTDETFCEGGIRGIQSKDICCVAECGQCGGVGCSSASGLSSTECCESGVRATHSLCADVGAAPCIVSDPTLTAPTLETTTSVEAVDSYWYLGCYADVDADRIMSTVYASANMTTEVCEKSCIGNKFFGTQFGEECWCGRYQTEHTKHGDSEDCTYECIGNATQTCGGRDAMSVYEYTNLPYYYGCFADNITDRIMKKTLVDPLMTTQMCLEECEGSQHFGLQYSVECWCGISGVDPYQYGYSENCDMSCGGDSAETCGGRHTMDIYKYYD